MCRAGEELGYKVGDINAGLQDGGFTLADTTTTTGILNYDGDINAGLQDGGFTLADTTTTAGTVSYATKWEISTPGCRTVGSHQRIFMDKELTAVPFGVTTSVFCCRKPEAIRKTGARSL